VTDRVTLRDGTTLACRGLRADDAERLRAFHTTLSAASARRRFFDDKPELAPQEAAELCNVDGRECCALVVLGPDTEFVAVGRYWRIEPDTAEAAFVVTDAWQGHGIATALLGALADRGRAAGIRRLVADTAEDNDAMIDVFEHAALTHRRVDVYGLAHFEFDLD